MLLKELSHDDLVRLTTLLFIMLKSQDKPDGHYGITCEGYPTDLLAVNITENGFSIS